jgi:signal transduction histidine kinase
MLTDLLGLQPPALDGARAQIDHIRDSAKRLTGMVDALISDAMSDALDISIRSQMIDLVALVDRVVEANRPLAERKDQVVEVRKPEALVATGDPDRLQEAVDNLVSNAVKYGPVGSAITVEVKARGDRNAIAVHDEGPGLSPEDVARLFGRFQRLSAKPTAGESSTGLGLSIAKRIVELHGGSIETESGGPGQGATFTILLPAEARPPAGARP